MTTCRMFVLLLAWLSLAAGATQNQLHAEEYRVYASLLAHGLPVETRRIVIAEQTTHHVETLRLLATDTREAAADLSVPRSVVEDFLVVNRESGALDRALDLSVDYVLLDKAQINALFEGEGWRQFYDRYPGTPGIVRLSRVGFDPELANALVMIEQLCGTECGAGRLVHLRRTYATDWEVVSGELVWMSVADDDDD